MLFADSLEPAEEGMSKCHTCTVFSMPVSLLSASSKR